MLEMPRGFRGGGSLESLAAKDGKGLGGAVVSSPRWTLATPRSPWLMAPLWLFASCLPALSPVGRSRPPQRPLLSRFHSISGPPRARTQGPAPSGRRTPFPRPSGGGLVVGGTAHEMSPEVASFRLLTTSGWKLGRAMAANGGWETIANPGDAVNPTHPLPLARVSPCSPLQGKAWLE